MKSDTSHVGRASPEVPGDQSAIGRQPDSYGTTWQTALIAALTTRIEEDARRRFAFASGSLSAADNAAVVREVIEHSRRRGLYLQTFALATLRRAHRRHACNHQAELYAQLLGTAALFHDVGKLAVPARILGKPARLDAREFAAVERHPLVGAHMIGTAATGMPADFAQAAKVIAALHHERWDGSGYPFGLSGTRIPLAARMMAIVDVYDALVHKRVYKQALSHEDAVFTIRHGRARHFDPELVDIFVCIADSMAHLAPPAERQTSVWASSR